MLTHYAPLNDLWADLESLDHGQQANAHAALGTALPVSPGTMDAPAADYNFLAYCIGAPQRSRAKSQPQPRVARRHALCLCSMKRRIAPDCPVHSKFAWKPLATNRSRPRTIAPKACAPPPPPLPLPLLAPAKICPSALKSCAVPPPAKICPSARKPCAVPAPAKLSPAAVSPCGSAVSLSGSSDSVPRPMLLPPTRTAQHLQAFAALQVREQTVLLAAQCTGYVYHALADVRGTRYVPFLCAVLCVGTPVRRLEPRFPDAYAYRALAHDYCTEAYASTARDDADALTRHMDALLDCMPVGDSSVERCDACSLRAPAHGCIAHVRSAATGITYQVPLAYVECWLEPASASRRVYCAVCATSQRVLGTDTDAQHDAARHERLDMQYSSDLRALIQPCV